MDDVIALRVLGIVSYDRLSSNGMAVATLDQTISL